MRSLEIAVGNRRLDAFLARSVPFFVFCAAAQPALAQTMVGNSLLTFAANYIIGPLGVFAVVAALAGSIFRPDMVKSAVYAAVICAVLFFIIKMSPQLITALRT